MDNNVGALQTIPMGGATQDATGEKRAKQPRPAGLSSPRVQQTFSTYSSHAKEPGAGPLRTESALGPGKPLGMGKGVWICSGRRLRGQVRHSLLDHDAVRPERLGNWGRVTHLHLSGCFF